MPQATSPGFSSYSRALRFSSMPTRRRERAVQHRRLGRYLSRRWRAGLAIGTKITLLVPVAVLAAGVLLLARPGQRARVGALWLGGLVATGGYWYLRNLVHVGNPLPWIAIGPLAGPDQVGLYPRPPHSVADYATDFHVWTHTFGPSLVRMLGHFWPLVLVGAVAGVVLASLRGPALHRVLGGAVLAAAIAYAFIPVSASGSPGHPSGFESNLRYLAPAITVGLILMALELGRRRNRAALLAAVMVAIFAFDALTSPTWHASQLVAGVLLALALVVAPAAIMRLWLVGVSTGRLALFASACLALTVAVGYQSQKEYLHSRYEPSLAPPADNPGFRSTPEWRLLQGWARRGAFGEDRRLRPSRRLRPVRLLRPGPLESGRVRGGSHAARRLQTDRQLRHLAAHD